MCAHQNFRSFPLVGRTRMTNANGDSHWTKKRYPHDDIEDKITQKIERIGTGRSIAETKTRKTARTYRAAAAEAREEGKLCVKPAQVSILSFLQVLN